MGFLPTLTRRFVPLSLQPVANDLRPRVGTLPHPKDFAVYCKIFGYSSRINPNEKCEYERTPI